MHSLFLKGFGFLLIVVVMAALVVVMSSAHWWERLDAAHVIYDGQNLPNADVYRSPSGELLLLIPDRPDERSSLVVYAKENKVGMPNTEHFFVLPGYVFSRYVPPHVVFVDDPVKAGIDPKLQIRSHSVEFLTLRGRRVQITVD